MQRKTKMCHLYFSVKKVVELAELLREYKSHIITFSRKSVVRQLIIGITVFN